MAGRGWRCDNKAGGWTGSFDVSGGDLMDVDMEPDEADDAGPIAVTAFHVKPRRRPVRFGRSVVTPSQPSVHLTERTLPRFAVLEEMTGRTGVGRQFTVNPSALRLAVSAPSDQRSPDITAEAGRVGSERSEEIRSEEIPGSGATCAESGANALREQDGSGDRLCSSALIHGRPVREESSVRDHRGSVRGAHEARAFDTGSRMASS